MDQIKMGSLLRRLRKECGWTQQQLAEKISVSDKTVSKWERGEGCPEVSLLARLSELFQTDLEQLLSGELEENPVSAGNMKKLRFHVCPHCGNLVMSMQEGSIACCGKKLPALMPKQADPADRLCVETVENEFYITSTHPMERAHSLSFVALLTADSCILRKTYPEWDLQLRIPILAHGTLLWYCTRDGLFYQKV